MWGRLHRTADIPLPVGKNIDEALAIERERHRPAYLRTVERRRLAVHDQIGTLVSWLQITDCLWRLSLDVFYQRHGDPKRKCQVEFTGNERKDRRRAVCNYSPFDTVEIGASLLPILCIPLELDGFVRFIGHEFERSGADWMLPHFLRRYMTRVNRRVPRGEQRKNGRLRSFEVKRRRVAFGTDRFQIAVPRL